MTVDFGDYFWGDKNVGFDVLYHNMKHGLVASKELTEFLRERANIEENNSKLLGKLAKQSGGSGTFAPLWQILKTSVERIAGLHLQMMHKVNELVKEVSKYTDELQKKHKLVKEEQGPTLEVVQSIQSTTLVLQKAKDAYLQKCEELEKLKRENTSFKDLEKAEIKVKKAQEDYKTVVDKYALIKEDFEKKMSLSCKYFQQVEEAHLKQMKDFLSTYTEVIENNHDLIGQIYVELKRQCLELTIEKLLEQFVLKKYTGLEKPVLIKEDLVPVSPLLNLNQTESSLANTPSGLTAEVKSLSSNGETLKPQKREGNAGMCGKQSRRTTSLLNLFISTSQGNKEAVLSPQGLSGVVGSGMPTSAPSSPNTASSNVPMAAPVITLSRNPLRNSKWFLRSRREKRKEKKSKLKKFGSESISKEDSNDGKVQGSKSETPTPEVDEEGYCIRPRDEIWDAEKFYSSSDSDSDDERDRKIHVEIKPLTNVNPISASVDELRVTAGNLTLSPIVKERRSSVDVNTADPKRKMSNSNDLADLNYAFIKNVGSDSAASTPQDKSDAVDITSPSSDVTLPNGINTTPTTFNNKMKRNTSDMSSRYADLGDLFSEISESVPALPPKQVAVTRATTTPSFSPATSTISLPRPPSRRSEQLRNAVSPVNTSTLSRSDNNEFKTSGVSTSNSSRGPSPLTIGMSDVVPLAVAFHEIIHSYFRGTDETRCQVKMSGDMMVSFPAGIVNILTSNPTPAQLKFKISNVAHLDNLLPNKQLITMEEIKSNKSSINFEFQMSALTSLLRKQCEQNPSASYFNVDILKYQIKPKPGAESCPFQLVSHWKCEPAHTDLKVDYKYNSHAMATPSPLLNVVVVIPVDGGVKNVQSKPSVQWMPESNRALWKFTDLSQHSDNHGIGCVKARFELNKGPGTPSTIAAQFNCEGTTLSGADFELIGAGYRVSLVKRKFMSGKYICDGDFENKTYATTMTSPSPSEFSN